MLHFVLRQNIERFKARLAIESDPIQAARLRELLAGEEAKLSRLDLQAVAPASDTGSDAPT